MRKLLLLLLLTSFATAQNIVVNSIQYSPTLTVGTLPSAGPNSGRIFLVTDGTGPSDCAVGSGSSYVWCTSNGASYAAVGGGISSLAFSGLTSGTNLSAQMAVGSSSASPSSASLVPAGSGQVTSTTSWLNPGGAGLFAPIPALSASLTGGSLSTGGVVYVQITLSNSFGESLPSTETNISLNGGTGCGSGVVCSVTVTAPTLLAGQTYTVYSNSSPGIEKKQAASNACINITSNCLIKIVGAGASVPSTNTTIPVNPSPLGSSSTCAPFNTSGYVQDTSGNFQPAWAVDTTSAYVGFGKGNLTFCRPVIFNTTGAAPNFVPNGAFTVFHKPSNTTTTVATQTQLNEDATDSATYPGQWLGNYTEVDIRGTPTLQGGSIFGQVNSGAGRFVNSYKPTGANNAGSGTGLSATIFRESGMTDASNCGAVECYIGTQSYAINLSNTTSSFRRYAAYVGEATTVGVADAGGAGIVFRGYAPTANGARFGGANYGIWIDDFGSTLGDWATFYPSNTAGTSSRHYFGGPVVLNGGMLGTLGVTQVTTPSSQPQLAVTCIATCTATYSYKAVPFDAGGGRGIATAAVSTAVGATVLNGSNFNTINFNTGGYTLPLASFGVVGWDIYRTVTTGSPATVGYLGTVPCVAAGGGGCTFVDNGVAISTPTNAEPVTPPTVNDTGAIGGYTFVTKTNCKVNSASPAACAAAPAGSVVIPTTTTTYTVNTTVVTTNSEIQITFRTDATGLPSAPTCVAPNITTLPVVSARVPFTSFTITMTSTAGQTCFDYNITN